MVASLQGPSLGVAPSETARPGQLGSRRLGASPLVVADCRAELDGVSSPPTPSGAETA